MVTSVKEITNQIHGVIPNNTPKGIETKIHVQEVKEALPEPLKIPARISNIHMVVNEGPTTIFKILYTNGFKAHVSITGSNLKAKTIITTIQKRLERIKELGEANYIIATHVHRIKQKPAPVLSVSNNIKEEDNYNISHKRFLLSLMRNKNFFKTVENSFVEDKDFISKYKDLPKQDLDHLYNQFSKKHETSLRQRVKLQK